MSTPVSVLVAACIEQKIFTSEVLRLALYLFHRCKIHFPEDNLLAAAAASAAAKLLDYHVDCINLSAFASVDLHAVYDLEFDIFLWIQFSVPQFDEIKRLLFDLFKILFGYQQLTNMVQLELLQLLNLMCFKGTFAAEVTENQELEISAIILLHFVRQRLPKFDWTDLLLYSQKIGRGVEFIFEKSIEWF